MITTREEESVCKLKNKLSTIHQTSKYYYVLIITYMVRYTDFHYIAVLCKTLSNEKLGVL